MKNLFIETSEQTEVIDTDTLQKLPEYVNAEKQFAHLQKTDKRRYFKQRSTLLFSLAKLGKINRQTAAYFIADCMKDDALMADRDIERIVMFAGELGLPYQHATAEATKTAYDSAWQQLEENIKQL